MCKPYDLRYGICVVEKQALGVKLEETWVVEQIRCSNQLAVLAAARPAAVEREYRVQTERHSLDTPVFIGHDREVKKFVWLKQSTRTCESHVKDHAEHGEGLWVVVLERDVFAVREVGAFLEARAKECAEVRRDQAEKAGENFQADLLAFRSDEKVDIATEVDLLRRLCHGGRSERVRLKPVWK